MNFLSLWTFFSKTVNTFEVCVPSTQIYPKFGVKMGRNGHKTDIQMKWVAALVRVFCSCKPKWTQPDKMGPCIVVGLSFPPFHLCFIQKDQGGRLRPHDIVKLRNYLCISMLVTVEAKQLILDHNTYKRYINLSMFSPKKIKLQTKIILSTWHPAHSKEIPTTFSSPREITPAEQ